LRSGPPACEFWQMEDPEVPTEHLQEHIEHGLHGSKASWVMGVALSSALLAGLAAVCSLLAGHHSNEAMMEQIQSSDQWAFYQAKGIKAAVLQSKIAILQAEGKPESEADRAKLAEYTKQQEEIQDLAKEKQRAADEHLGRHVIFARGVTLFQIAIAIGAISVLTQRKRFWWVSLVFGALGVFFLLQGILTGPR
jgi:Flp pilus assembly protein TadB